MTKLIFFREIVVAKAMINNNSRSSNSTSTECARAEKQEKKEKKRVSKEKAHFGERSRVTRLKKLKVVKLAQEKAKCIILLKSRNVLTQKPPINCKIAFILSPGYTLRFTFCQSKASDPIQNEFYWRIEISPQASSKVATFFLEILTILLQPSLHIHSSSYYSSRKEQLTRPVDIGHTHIIYLRAWLAYLLKLLGRRLVAHTLFTAALLSLLLLLLSVHVCEIMQLLLWRYICPYYSVCTRYFNKYVSST